MKIDKALIDYLEELSCLSLSEEEKIRLTGDLESILAAMDKLNELDTVGFQERNHPFDGVNSFREDIVLPSLERELVLQNAPQRNAEAFVVPKTVE
ncbi:MAG: Asp-tRNA(Asn)/Glu-tRNA(Gln) amidotransferase subunit GatC [Oscillospiraceae bacterium]|nr:Asp-tRNA(Asn)/Glu-tRNA(Gln) amidotransferase subunit GatC [Oscillospiraceae bacterium]